MMAQFLTVMELIGWSLLFILFGRNTNLAFTKRFYLVGSILTFKKEFNSLVLKSNGIN